MTTENHQVNSTVKSAREQSVSRKILIPTLVILSLVFIGFLIFNYVTSVSDAQANEISNSREAERLFQVELDNATSFAAGLALQAASNPEIQALFAAQDREALEAITYATFQELEEEYQIRQFQFHLPPATSFLRLHNVKNYGDDLSSFRFTVVEVNSTQRPVAGLEVGRGGAGIRGVQPIFYQGKHIGSVEFGTNFDDAFVNNLKNEFGYDWRIILTRESLSLATLEDLSVLKDGPTPETLVLASTIEGIYTDVDTYTGVLDGLRFINRVTSNNRNYSLTSMPLRDYSGKIIGIVDVIIDHTDLIRAQNTRLTILVIGAVITLIAGAFIMTNITTRVLYPLDELTQATAAIERGDLNRRVKIYSQDEIGKLGNAFNQMAAQLREFFNTLEERIAARTRAIETGAIVGRRLSTILNADTLVNSVVDELQQAFGYYHTQIYLLEKDVNQEEFEEAIPPEGILRLAGGTGSAGVELVNQKHYIAWGKGLVGKAASTGMPVLSANTRSDPTWLPNPLLPETNAELAVPIMTGDEVLGTLDVQHNIAGGLSQQDIDLLQIIASQIAVALRNARLYEEARHQGDRDAMISSIVDQVQKTTSVEQAMKVAVREIGRAVGQRPSLVWLTAAPDQDEPTDGEL